MKNRSTIWPNNMMHFVNKHVNTTEYVCVHQPMLPKKDSHHFGVRMKRTDACWQSFLLLLWAYNETPTQTLSGIHTPEQRGSVWRQPLTNVHIKSMWGITLQTGSKTCRCHAAVEEQTTQAAHRKTVFLYKGLSLWRDLIWSQISLALLCWRSGPQAPDGLLLIGGNVAIQLQSLCIDFLQVQ